MRSNPNKKTAILLFAISAEEELRRKSIRDGKVLFSALTERILKEVRKTGLPYFHFTENEQEGHSFGERFANAIESVFELGFDCLVTIGNDSPQLHHGHLRTAIDALHDGKSVLGPSVDGGFYLMALHKTNFSKAHFVSLPWQTNCILHETKAYFTGLGQEILTLQALIDIDHVAQIKPLLNHISVLGGQLLSLLTRFYAKSKSIISESEIIYAPILSTTPHNKGSPAQQHYFR